MSAFTCRSELPCHSNVGLFHWKRLRPGRQGTTRLNDCVLESETQTHTHTHTHTLSLPTYDLTSGLRTVDRRRGSRVKSPAGNLSGQGLNVGADRLKQFRRVTGQCYRAAAHASPARSAVNRQDARSYSHHATLTLLKITFSSCLQRQYKKLETVTVR